MVLVTNMNSSKIKYNVSNSSNNTVKRVNVSNSATITYNVKNDFNKVKPDLMNLVGAKDESKVNNIADVVKIAQENKNKPKVEMPDYDEEPEDVSFAGCVADTCKGYWNSFKSLGKKGKKKASDALKKADKVFEDLNATVASTCVSITEGAGKFGEALVDCSALAGTGLISLVTAPIDIARGTDFTDYMYDRTYKFIAKDHVGDTYDKFYDNTAAGKYLKEHSYGFNITRNISTTVGYVGGVVLTSYFTGGASAAAMGEVALVSGMGKGAETAYSNGAEGSEGATAALTTGLWEGLQFYVGGKINSLSPFTNTTANIATRVGLDTLDGASEGFAQPFISTIYQKGYVDPETGEYIEFTEDDSFGDRYKKIWTEQGGWKQVGTNAAVGFVMSGTAEGLGQVFKGSKVVKNADDISKKLDSVPFEQLDVADKEFVNNARKELKLADNVSAKEVLNEVDKINKNLNFDKVNVKDMDLTTMKKLSDSVDGLDPKVQKEILDGILGNKELKNIKNQGQFNYSMDKYLKSLDMDDLAKMDSKTRNILTNYMQDNLTKEGSPYVYNSAEELFDAYTKMKSLEEVNVGKQGIDNIDKTLPSVKDIDKTLPSIKDIDKTEPSIKGLEKTQPLNVTQPLDVTQPLNVTQPLWKGTDVTQPLNIKNQTNNTNNVVNNSTTNINKNFKEMDTYELHNSITKELQQLDPADPNYSYKASLIKQKEQLEMKLKNQMGGYNVGNETKSIDMLSSQDQKLVKKYSEKIYKNATKLEKNVTESMMYLEDSNTQLVGLDYRVKSLESIEDKVARLRGYGYSVENAAKEVNDSLRYTLLVDSANYEDTVLQKLTTLKKQGYDIKYVNNSWNNPVYKGLNVTLTSPEGMLVELQFHTENSFKVKQILNHDFHEISRNTSVDSNTKALANEIQKINQKLYSDNVKFSYNELELKQKINQLAQGKNKHVNLTPIKNGENAFDYAKSNNQNARLYKSFDEFSQATKKDMEKWRKYLKKQKYMDPQTGKVFTYEDLINGYIGENPNAPGSYKILNSVNRAMGANPSETLNNLLVKNMDGTPYVNSNGMYSIRIDSSGGTYSSFYYNPINNVVYGIGIDGADITFDQLLTRVNSETKALNEALQQGATGESMILGRGSSWHSLEKYGISKYDDADSIYQKLTQNGNIYVDNGFMSCTPELGGGFMGESVNYIITTKGDAGIGNFSFYNACEKEVLLGSGNKFDITGVRKADNGAVFIYLEQI